jgi:hypothetical protein
LEVSKVILFNEAEKEELTESLLIVSSSSGRQSGPHWHIVLAGKP